MYLDIFICVLLLWALFSGWKNGFIREAFSTIGIIVGLVLAGIAYLYWGENFLSVTGSETNMVLSIVAFVLLWICVPLFFGLIANILTKAINFVMLGWANRVLGMVFSVVKFALLLSCVLNMMSRLNITDKAIVADSKLYAPTVGLLPFIDEQAGVTDSLERYKDETIQRVLTGNDTIWVDFAGDKADSQKND